MNTKLIKLKLVEKEMTQGQLAEELHITQTSLSRKMHGITPFKLKELSALCRILKVDIIELMGEE